MRVGLQSVSRNWHFHSGHAYVIPGPGLADPRRLGELEDGEAQPDSEF